VTVAVRAWQPFPSVTTTEFAVDETFEMDIGLILKAAFQLILGRAWQFKGAMMSHQKTNSSHRQDPVPA
jgi:hypothetical protein